MTQSAWDPTHREEVPEAKIQEVAMLNAVVTKLGNVIEVLPQITANERVRQQLNILHQEAKGAVAVIKAEIVRAQTPDE